MKNLLAFVAAAVLMFVGVGWYLDWFQVLNGPSAFGHHKFEFDVNTAKIESDVEAGKEKVAGAIDKASKDAAARKAAAGTGDPINNTWDAPVKPPVGAGDR
jgi:hypothetical protein